MLCSPGLGVIYVEPGMKPLYAYMVLGNYIVEKEDGNLAVEIGRFIYDQLHPAPED
jgi:hypothetical protein